ncbi:MAG TPA: L-threonylcarbamoyladenylate synthase [Anaerolineaceae bacterium]|nr:L-threonylcarbamoyladenylate synthase [Anaerolineaceae bacterium]
MTTTTTISILDPGAIPAALTILREGGLIAFPTDTVYGLASGIDSEASIRQLFLAKGRNWTKAIAVLIGEMEQLPIVTPNLPPAALELASRFWPGALTLIVPRNIHLPALISPLPTIGVRMPNHPFALSLLRQTGPLATTSANLSGQTSPLTARDVINQLDGKVDLILDGGPCPGGVPSTVVDCTTPELRVLREGAISPKDLFPSGK